MESRQVYELVQPNPDEALDIPVEILKEHLAAIDRAYGQAGLDPRESTAKLCPGFTFEGTEFQVTMDVTSEGVIQGTHYRLSRHGGDSIEEGDVFVDDGMCDLAEGRRILPAYGTTSSYSIDKVKIQQLDAMIDEHIAAEHFTALPFESRFSFSE